MSRIRINHKKKSVPYRNAGAQKKLAGFMSWNFKAQQRTNFKHWIYISDNLSYILELIRIPHKKKYVPYRNVGAQKKFAGFMSWNFKVQQRTNFKHWIYRRSSQFAVFWGKEKSANIEIRELRGMI